MSLETNVSKQKIIDKESEKGVALTFYFIIAGFSLTLGRGIVGLPAIFKNLWSILYPHRLNSDTKLLTQSLSNYY